MQTLVESIHTLEAMSIEADGEHRTCIEMIDGASPTDAAELQTRADFFGRQVEALDRAILSLRDPANLDRAIAAVRDV